MEQVQIEGNRKVDFYNLDAIIAVGYRVNSKKATLFRRWATSVLKDYMIKGYALNQKRLDVLNKTILIQSRMLASTLNIEEKEVFSVIEAYSHALTLLDDYDHRTLKKIEGNIDDRKIKYQECIDIINKLKFNEESWLFAVERDKGLESIIGNIYQSFARARYLQEYRRKRS